jgi:lipoate-protein ligase A
MNSNAHAAPYEYSDEDFNQINKLVEEKYSTWDWNFGYSPKYNFEKFIKTNGGGIEIQMNIEKGVIQDLKIFGDFFNERDISEVEDCLKGQKHKVEDIRQKLNDLSFERYFHNISIDEFILAMF